MSVRIIPRGKTFYLQYYLPGNRSRPREVSTFLAIDDDIQVKLNAGLDWKTCETWWQPSEHAKKLEKLRKKAHGFKEAVRAGLMTVDQDPFVKPKAKPKKEEPVDLTIDHLLELYNADNKTVSGEKERATILHRKHAADWARKLGAAYVREIDRNYIADLRSYSEERVNGEPRYSSETLRGYVGVLRSIWEFLLEEDLHIKYNLAPSKNESFKNVWKKLKFKSRKKLPKKFPLEHQKKIFWFTYHIDPRLLAQCLGLRTSGVRLKESCTIRKDQIDIDGRTIYHHNKKVDRYEDVPLSDAFIFGYRLAIEHSTSDQGERLFYYLSPKTVRTYLGQVCEYLGLPHYTPHDFKRAFTNELDEMGIPDRVLTTLAHHAPQGETKVIQGHYSRNFKFASEIIQEAQQDLYEFLLTLPTSAPPEGGPFYLSNPNANSSRHRKVDARRAHGELISGPKRQTNIRERMSV